MGRYALIIGTDQYSDPKLAQLKTPAADAQAMAQVLADAQIGQFDQVQQCINEQEYEVRRAIAEFVEDKKPDDLVLIYFSGHGVQDSSGRLHLALKDTVTKIVSATAIPMQFVIQELDSCRSKKQVLILDCCHSGAFAITGLKADAKAVTRATFEGEGSGRVVMTATDALQFALEGDQVLKDTNFSLFTHFLLAGLKTGEADRDRDGFVSAEEWFDYGHDQVRSVTDRQSPHLWNYGAEGDLLIGHSPVVTQAAKQTAAKSVASEPVAAQAAATVAPTPEPVAPAPFATGQPGVSFTPEWIAANKITLSNGIELMRVPAGDFWMGTKSSYKGPQSRTPLWSVRNGPPASASELLRPLEHNGPGSFEFPQHRVNIAYDYWMARLPVTYQQYQQNGGVVRPQPADYPVTLVSWKSAQEWCERLNAQYGRELPPGLVLRLPTEAEWEMAARGTDGRLYPWGDEFDASKCNSIEAGRVMIVTVGSYSPQGDSPYGCADMAGNVMQWTHSLMKQYPYDPLDGREQEENGAIRQLSNADDKDHVLRGGCYIFNQNLARCAYRYWMHYTFDKELFQYIGFRVAAGPKLQG